MSTAHEFETSVSWTGGREGRLESPGLPALEVASPPVFDGPGGKWTPEHFFVAAAELCTMLTFVAMADYSKIEIRAWRSRAIGKLEKVEGQGFQFTSVEIKPRIEIGKSVDRARVERLLEKAESACLVSRSLKTPVRITAEIVASTAV